MNRILMKLCLIFTALFLSGCATSEEFDKEFNNFLGYVVPKFTIETEAGYKGAGEEYSQCMRSCLAHNEDKQCIEYSKKASSECDKFLGK